MNVVTRVAAAALLLTGVYARAATPTLAPAPVARDGVWAQTYVDRPADPAVLFGQLPNGLRFAVMHNATPRKGVSMRLLIASGSLAERADQQGLAHFVEHMAFRGSTHVPDGELMRTLERHGLANGADTNAYTTQESTFFQFDLPENDAETVATGLRFLRETATEVTFAPGAVVAERAVILAEERQRDSPAVRAQRASLGFILAGQPAGERWPIGLTATIAAATPAQLRDFYAVHYRPDNATVIVAGDIDPAAMVAAVTAKFGDWARPATPLVPVDHGTPLVRGTDAKVFTAPGVSHSVAVAWVRPFDATADTTAHRRDLLLALIATRIFNQRLQDMALAADPAFFVARLERTNLLHAANITAIDFHGSFDRWPQAMAAVVGEQRRMLEHGVTVAEVARQVSQLKVALSTAQAGGGTRPSAALATTLMGAALHDLVFSSPAQDLAEFAATVPEITPATIDAAFKTAFDGAGPLLFLTAAGSVPDGETKLRTAFAAATAAPLTAAAAAGTTVWPYDDFGSPGRVVARHVVDKLGVTVVTFANGATLLIKPTTFAKDSIDVAVRFGQGRAGLPSAKANAFWTANGVMPVFVNGGTTKASTTDLQRLLADRVAGIELTTGDAAFDLRGRTRPADLPRQLQLMTAYLKEPGYRVESFDRLKRAMAASLLQLDNEPNLVMYRARERALHDGDSRWTTMPDAADVGATTLEDVRALFGTALRQGPLGVVIVGDVDVEQVIAAVAATIGTLPRPTSAVPSRGGIRFPLPNDLPATVLHQGRSDKALALAAWRVTDFYAAPRDARALIVAMALLRSRVTDRMRGADGLTYSPSVDGSFSTDFDGYGTVEAQLELAPDKIDEFYAKLDAIVLDLAKHEPTPDELERAKAPIIEERVHSLQNNGYWVAALARATRDAREFPTIVERVSAVEAVSGADVRRVVARYLQPAATFRLVVRPPQRPLRPFAGSSRTAVPLCSNKFVRACQPGG